MNTQLRLNQSSKRTLDFRQKYKTEKCRYWYQKGFCPFFQFCAFAHAEFELRDKHSINQSYKTRICYNFKNKGYCKYGERCLFLHIQDTSQNCHRTAASIQGYSADYHDKQSVSTNDQIESKHQKDLKILAQFGLEILGTKKGAGLMRGRSLLMECGHLEGRDEEKQRSEGTPQEDEFEQMFPEYNFCKKPRLGSI